MNNSRPIIIAGPCAAESFEIMDEVASYMSDLSKKLGFDLVFKASFDKANRTSITSYRGPGISTAMKWFGDIKAKYQVKVLTDIHETVQAKPAGEVCDYLQIPAFLCRQTDLLIAAISTNKWVNIKKGQFVSPASMANAVNKCREAAASSAIDCKVMLTERGSSFGYGDLVVDMRGLAIMAANRVPIIFDVTHSTQKPAAGSGAASVSGALRQYAPLLARAACSTGYIDGLFLETHPNPSNALSDAEAQLSKEQISSLLENVLPILSNRSTLKQWDGIFGA